MAEEAMVEEATAEEATVEAAMVEEAKVTVFKSFVNQKMLTPKVWVWVVLIIFFGTLTCQIIMQQILLIFWEKNTYTTLLGPTRLLISEIFPSKPDFHLYK